LAAQESLFVIFSEEPGSFFGKLDKISLKEQDEMASELYNVYSSLHNPPLLYSHDNTSRLGHYGVLQSHGDQNYSYHSFRRVLVISELSEDVLVYFIDYGNSFWISRFKILAPLECLKNFRQPPHGIHCKLEEISLEVSKWESSILDKWVKVHVGVCAERIHMVTLTEDSLNEELGLLDKTETPPSLYDCKCTLSILSSIL
jgi:tudor domain-containing protein 1/4/6/7